MLPNQTLTPMLTPTLMTVGTRGTRWIETPHCPKLQVKFLYFRVDEEPGI